MHGEASIDGGQSLRPGNPPRPSGATRYRFEPPKPPETIRAWHLVACRCMNQPVESHWGKVPEVTLWFWIIKIAATTMGETGGDAVTMSMTSDTPSARPSSCALRHSGGGADQRAAVPPVPLLGRDRRHDDAGTTLADLLDRSLGIGYLGGTAILLAALLATLFLWYRSLGSVNVSDIASRKAETFYWATIMFSQTLGTALATGRRRPGGLGFGYEGGAVVFASASRSSPQPISGHASLAFSCSGRRSS